jgi:hypothetical protein
MTSSNLFSRKWRKILDIYMEKVKSCDLDGLVKMLYEIREEKKALSTDHIKQIILNHVKDSVLASIIKKNPSPELKQKIWDELSILLPGTRYGKDAE